MQKQYPVILDDECVGSISLEKQGLVAIVRCICKPSANRTYELILENGSIGTQNLGVCVQFEDGIGLVKRIPVKSLALESLRFWLKPRNNESQSIFVSVDPKEPFCYIERITDGRMDIERGVYGIRFPQIESSRPTGQ